MKRQKPDDKQIFIISLVGVITLIIVMIGATYAYFTATTDGEGNIETNVGTSTTDNLSFAFGEEIHISATEENFAQGMPSLSDSTTGTALLRPNNYNNQATATYNIYLIIENNNFEYTTENHTPEILLNVTAPTGERLENITGLVHTEDGFDITTRVGGFLIISDYEITAEQAEEIQNWDIEVTFVNLDSDQELNTEKTLTAKLYLTQEKMSSYELIEINNMETSTTYNSIDATLDLANGTADPEKYYYGIEKTEDAIALNESKVARLSNTLASADTVEYVESNEASHTFTNLDSNTEYTIYSYVVDTNDVKSNVYQTNVTTGEYSASTVDNVSHSVTLNSITLNVTASNGSNEIVKYMYSINNGTSWEESESNTYTFNDLADSTTYHVMVKVVDSEGIESTPYYEAITTTVYVLPVVANVTAEKTWNSITLTPTGTDGTNEVDHYLYSIDNGSYQESNIFSDLNDNQEYTIHVKAVDTEGRESEPYEITVTTDEYVLPTISSVKVTDTESSITLNVTASGGTGSIVTYHYSKDNGLTYEVSNNANHTFTNLTTDVTFYIKVYVTDSNGKVSGEYSLQATTSLPTIADSCSGVSASNCIINQLYTTDGTNGLYYHNGSGSYTNAYLEAGDNSYRYSGANPNNYVCFGSNEKDCPATNLYRIVGIFNGQIKLIKNQILGNYEWTGTYYSWTTSPLNNNTLNGTFLSSLGTWANMISYSTWKIGGVEQMSGYNSNAQTAYNYEVGRYSNNVTTSAKVGLMYLSDYYYAASPTYWSYPGCNIYGFGDNDYGNAKSTNWMNINVFEWTITYMPNSASHVYYVASQGYVVSNHVAATHGARPTFYLNSNVKLIDGDGSSTNPYRVSL